MDRRTFIGGAMLGAAWALGRAPAHAATGDDVFEEAGVEGCFVILAVARDETTVVNAAIAERGFPPASTFKIPNTIIGLETGVIPDERFSLPWNGVRSDLVEAWNRDHDLGSAMKHSVLWFYQEVARRIGEDRYREWLVKLDYGNRDLGGGVDRFWVSPEAGLRITPREQVRFLSRLMRGDLPVSARSVRILRDILPTATNAGVTLRAKTGMAGQGERTLGWLVGFVESPGLSHVFACLVMGSDRQAWRTSPVFAARREVPLRLLKRMGVVPPGMGRPG